MTDGVYNDLIAIARRMLRHEPSSDLDAGDLVSLAIERILRSDRPDLERKLRRDPEAIVGLLVLHMRRELVTQGRARRAAKRTAPAGRESAVTPPPSDLAIDLERLIAQYGEERHPDAAEAFRLALQGIESETIARKFGRSTHAVAKWLGQVRAWLVARLEAAPA